MVFLLRVELPDLPGSLGALTSALGATGSDISAIQVIEHRSDGMVIDDVLVEPAADVMPDALVSACQQLDGVRVQWISRYVAGASLSMDLEALEALATKPSAVLARLVDVVPKTFRADWAIVMSTDPHDSQRPVVQHAHEAAPPLPDAAAHWLDIDEPTVMAHIPGWDTTIFAVIPGRAENKPPFDLIIARQGGPEFLKSELARLGLLVTLAASLHHNTAAT